MKLTIENLGALRHGEIELADLTIVCGENNTGKTYLTYTLYGLLQYLNSEPDFIGNNDCQELGKSHFEINLVEAQVSIKHHVEAAISGFTKRLGNTLSGQQSRFDSTTLKSDLTIDPNFLARSLSRQIRVGPREIIIVEKKPDDPVLRATSASEDLEQFPKALWMRILSEALLDVFFRHEVPNVFIVSTERTGAVTFKNELNLTKNRLIDVAHQMDASDQMNPFRIWEALQKSAYPLPVRDNLDFLTTLSTSARRDSFLKSDSPELLNDFTDLIGGALGVDKQSSDIYFQPKANQSMKLAANESSSSVRSLLLLGFYLKHIANRGDLLIVDEPELNLHPKSQRRLARLLVRLANSGLRLFITTHSDYLVREINNLIVLHGLGERAKRVMEKHRYVETDLISSERVSCYSLVSERFKAPGEARTRKDERVRIKKAAITPSDGIEETTFDKTIEQMNDLYRDILAADESPIDVIG